MKFEERLYFSANLGKWIHHFVVPGHRGHRPLITFSSTQVIAIQKMNLTQNCFIIFRMSLCESTDISLREYISKALLLANYQCIPSVPINVCVLGSTH